MTVPSVRQRVAVLTSDGPHHAYLIAALYAAPHVAVALVAIEPGIEQLARRRRERRWSAWLWLLYHGLRRRVTGMERYRRAYFDACVDAVLIEPGHEANDTTLRVNDINAPSVAEALKRVDPDVVIVMGTSILKETTLRSTSAPFVNIHGGYLPYYRGNHCCFFAVLHGDLERVGSTIHKVDRGIDTGEIVTRVPVAYQRGDTPESLYCRAEQRAVEELLELLRVPVAQWPSSPQPSVGRTYRTRDRRLVDEFRLAIRLRRLRHTAVTRLEVVNV